jgi:hypothetical protein
VPPPGGTLAFASPAVASDHSALAIYLFFGVKMICAKIAAVFAKQFTTPVADAHSSA